MGTWTYMCGVMLVVVHVSWSSSEPVPLHWLFTYTVMLMLNGWIDDN
jgi:hypothetical protein